LDSILPYKYFHKFVQTEFKDFNVYLKVATTYRRMLAVERMLNDTATDSERQRINEEKEVFH
jgi:hypothetical protein